jgi:Putative porin
MKALLTWFTIFVVAGSALAQTDAAPAKPKKRAHRAAAMAPAPPPVTADDLKALRDALAQQQAQIQELQGKMAERDATLQQTQQQLQQAQSQLQDTQSKAATAVTTASQTSDSVSRLQSDVADIRTNTTNLAASTQEDQKKVSLLQNAIGRFRFSGDVRVRGENFTQNGIQDRNRARIRVRLGLEGALNQDFIAGVALATGSQGDPTTTNETLTNAFDRKTIALDKGYITYNPVAHNWFSVTGGKFAYLWQRTSVTGDPDLNPEGFDAKLSFNEHGFFTNFTLQGITLLYNESSGGQDSYVLGGQAQTTFKAGPWSATASFLNEHWNRPDALLGASAFEVGATATGYQPGGSPLPSPVTGIPVPGEGPGCASLSVGTPKFPPCVFAPNGMTNATYVDASGKPHFYSGFDEADFILNNTIKTPAARLPINWLIEFEDNLDAKAHPLDSKGNVISSLGSQNKEYGSDLSIGQTKNKNDLQFGYAWLRQEQDSVLASIAESDQRSPTNIVQNRIYANWKLRANTVASFSYWRGRVLNTNLENNAALIQKTIKTPGTQEPYLNRLQFDLVYTY